MQIDRPITIIK